MHQCYESHMRSPFKHIKNSPSSLEGMERPVRSFLSFIQTTPPRPTSTEKNLPSTPSSPSPRKKNTKKKEYPASPSPVDRPSKHLVRKASAASWKAPAEWYNDHTNGQPPAPSPGTPGLAAPRTYSPLIPEPTPHIFDVMNFEATMWMGPSSPGGSRLVPIYEGPNSMSELGPPKTPPQSPLPATPITNISPMNRPDLSDLRRVARLMSGRAAEPDVFDHAHTSDAPTNSPLTPDTPTKNKAFLNLGIDTSQERTPLQEPDAETGLPDQRRADRHHIRGKKHRALNKGNPLADDSWEDEDMDDKTRQLSFSQDYHDLLADQYQEMNVQAEEVLSSGGAYHVYEAKFEEKEQTPNIPPEYRDLEQTRPLAQLGQPISRSDTSDKEIMQPAPSESNPKHKRLSAWVPHRLVRKPSRIATIRLDELSESDHEKPNQTQNELQDVRSPKHDHHFSTFFHSHRPIRFPSKSKKSSTTRPSRSAPPPKSPTPLMRLPGGYALVRHAPTLPPKLSTKIPPHPHARDSFNLGSDYSQHSLSDHRSSFASRHSESPVAPGISIRTALHTSSSSSYSQHSDSSHPLAQELSYAEKTASATRSLPQQSPPPIYPPSTPALSPSMSLPISTFSQRNLPRHKPSLIEKAREARRKHSREARQVRLKRSIRVLGPTDPGVVRGYVRPERRASEGDLTGGKGKRLPGYLVDVGS